MRARGFVVKCVRWQGYGMKICSAARGRRFNASGVELGLVCVDDNNMSWDFA